MSNEFEIPNEPTRAQIEEMIKRGLVTERTTCHFDSLHKGEWTYTFKVGEKICEIRGGRATYEAAYGLQLKATYSLERMLNQMND